MSLSPHQKSKPAMHRVRYPLTAVAILFLFLAFIFVQVNRADAVADLSVEIIAAPNLIVDSNVLSPSTYQPIVATVIGKFCNERSTGDLTNVIANIGDYKGGSGDTPGTYPATTANPTYTDGFVSTTYRGTYSFTHLGGAADATRNIGTLTPGECRHQYWSFTYPKTAIDDADGSTIPAWGNSVKPGDDMSLNFDIWATSSAGTTDGSHTMTMRNEISAMANKIKPNGNPGGQWFNTDTSTVNPGDTITTNGILYRLGNVNQGFDNDNDGIPDYNAWVQPFGDPAYDPSCFRLISTSGVLTVTRSGGNPDMIISFDDQLYFTDLPSDNTDVWGEVFYEFLAISGACTIPISPYQEVASGSDNEKFNGDYGTGIPPVASYAPEVDITKSAPGSANENTTVTYSLGFVNNSATSTGGLTLSSGGSVDAGLMISDTVPAGLVYVAGSAAGSNTIPSGNSVTIRYYITSTGTWTTTEPTASDVGKIQWWLDEPLAINGSGNNSGTVTFQATIPSGYITGGGDPFIENCATGHFGDAAAFAESCDTTMVNGTANIGDFVWKDDDNDGMIDGGEAGITAVQVSLYWDKNNDDQIDSEDVLVSTQDSSGTTQPSNYDFTGLPAGEYLVKVDRLDTDIDTVATGYALTTQEVFDVSLTTGQDYDTADFGFGPILDLTKSLTTGEYDGVGNDNLYEGQLANYNINVINTRPGSAGSSCDYAIPAGLSQNTGTGGTTWASPANAQRLADSAYAIATFASQPQTMEALQFISGSQGTISNVKLLLYTKEIVEMLAGDELIVEVFKGAVSVAGPTSYTGAGYFTSPAGTLYEIEINTWGQPWIWSDFDAAAANPVNIQFSADKGSGAGGAQIGLDAAVFVVTTTETCGGAEDTLNPVPVTDTFNPAELEFVSASPAVSAQTPAGTLTWNNVGPLTAGETQQIQVVFKVLAASGVVNNAAASTNAKYLDDRTANSVNDNVNADILPAVDIGDTVWFDADSSGAQNGAEPGLAGVVVELRLTGNTTIFYNGQTYVQNDLIATTVTDANGNYLFEGVPGDTDGGSNPYDYSVTINTGASAILTNLSSTTGGDSQASANLTSADDLARDFGYTSANSIVYGFVWHDKNADANDPTVDTGETYISGVTVELCTDAAGTTCVASTTTDENGRYQFTDVSDNTYYVVVTPPGTQVAEPTGENTKTACGGACANDNVTPAIVVANAIDKIYGGYDFGYQGADIGDTLYVDWNGDGSQNVTTEEGIPNIDVYLYRDQNGNGIVDAGEPLLETDTTDASGNYLFVDYPADNYLVIVDTGDPQFPGSYTATGDPDGAFDSKHKFTPDGVADKLDVDFGYQPQGYSTIGDYIWNDVDADNAQDSSESGFSGVTVYLYEDANGDGVIDATDAVINTTTTSASGIYTFTNLISATYTVQIISTNFNAGQPLDGYTLTSSGTAYNSSQISYKVALGNGETFLNADFGFAASAIGDFIWQDNDGDGVADLNEPGINGVLVNLYVDANNNGVLDGGESTAVATATTANNSLSEPGYYNFTGLEANNYIVEVDSSNFTGVLSGFTLTGDPDSYNTSDPSELSCTAVGATNCDNRKFLDDQASTSQYDVNPGLALGQTDLSADFGYQPQGILGDTAWIDVDNDGIRDGSEPGIADITINLCSDAACLTVVMTTTTDENGEYSFGGVTDGTYYVEVDTSDPDWPTGLTQTYIPDGGSADNQADGVVLAGGSVTDIGTVSCSNCDLNIDFGYRFVGNNSISGTVWHDTDNGGTPADDGIGDIDGTETVRYENVPVYLWYCGADTTCGSGGDDILLGSTLTNASGQYSFTGLADGTYRVIANGNALSLTGTSATTTTDYDDSPVTDPAAAVSGGSTAVRDFGFLSLVDLGDLPANYNATSLTDNGARHTVSSNLYLGASAPDADPDGAESANADGDDTAATADESGVTRQAGAANPANGGWTPGTVASGNGGSLEITIGGGWNGVPQVFVDFDGDDTTYTLAEVTLRDSGGTPLIMPLAPGAQRVYFDVPAGTFPNPIYVRVRLSTVGGLGVTGLAANGEVEDYLWQFGPTAVTLSNFQAQTNAPILVLAGMLLLAVTALFRRFVIRRRA